MTKQEFLSLSQSKIVILDGATGSNLQERGMPAGVCPEEWIISNSEVAIGLQREFLEAGTDILFAPTFTANRIKLAEYGLRDRLAAYNRGLVNISNEAIRQYRDKTGDYRKIYVAADITMTGEQIQPAGKLTFEELIDIYKEQVGHILEEGVDLFVIETMMSLQECRAALLAVKESCDLPVMVSLTYTENGLTLYGTDPQTAVIVLQAMGADAVGVNCSTGPDKMHAIVREMKKVAYVPIMVKPNAGLPKLIDSRTVFPMGAEEFAMETAKTTSEGASLIGGCCGSTPEHIRRLSERLRDVTPLPLNKNHVRALTTERKTVPISLDGRFLVIGERINPTGKKALQEELAAGTFHLVSRMAEEQEELGADILDINTGMPGIDEKETITKAVNEVLGVTDLPLSIDSSNIDAIEAALRIYPGRALINSISLEKEKYEKLIPIAKKYGAMFILLPLSKKGLPKDISEKKQIIHTILERAREYGMTGEDIIVDGLVTTIGANNNAALEALETIRYCRNELGLATVIGLSNISFGLPERQYINSTFLSFAIGAGLTMAIANPSQDLLMNSAYAADLLLGREHAADRYIERIKQSKESGNEAPIMQKKQYITEKAEMQKADINSKAAAQKGHIEMYNPVFTAVVKGRRTEIIKLVEDELHRNTQPEYILEEILIPAINEVGRLFDRQIYFLPQLIASAETMKAAVEYLEPKLTKSANYASRGTIVIATVAGDIHDIGKNLVTMMLKNYGYRIIDLGKDVPSDQIIKAAMEADADIIALSALMTTTMAEMKRVVKLVRESGLRAKVIVGGAVITKQYADEIGADGYSSDAQSAVSLVKQLLGQT